MRNLDKSLPKTFLALTALQNFWKKDSKILFLGEWCRLYHERNDWGKLNHSVLAYPWDDRKKLHADFFWIQSLYETRLVELANRLNEIHGTSHSIEYWRQLVGPWLNWFTSILYDRFLCLQAAEKHSEPLETRISAPDLSLSWTPNDFRNFSDWMADDRYNLHLYSEIVRFRQKIAYEMIPDSHSPQISVSKKLSLVTSAKSIFRKCLQSKFYRWLARSNRFVFVASYLSRWDQIRLQLALRQFPYVVEFTKSESFGKANQRLRSSLKMNAVGFDRDSFEALLAHLIPQQLPICYLEGFALVREKAQDKFPKKADRIISAVGIYGFEEFNFWCADMREKTTTQLVIEQHGGMYGAGLWLAPEVMELSISDQYFSWGWSDENRKVVPLPSGRLNRIRKNLKSNPSGPLLLCSGSLPRYAYFMYSVPVGPQMLSYIDDQVRFFKTLPANAQKILLHRLYPKDLGWNERERYAVRVPEMRIADSQLTFQTQLNQSRLFIGSYNATTFLETFAANFPTVLFWNPDLWEIRPEAKSLYLSLENAGILHRTPESAATFIGQIYLDPEMWWNTPSTQAAKDGFIETFARADDDWIQQWVTALNCEKPR